jgi:hypothetical protein
MYPILTPHSGGKDLLLLDYIDVYMFIMLPVAYGDDYRNYKNYGGYEDEFFR